MPTITLTVQQKARVEHAAWRMGLTCKVCQSIDLISRDTGIAYADGALRVYMDCAVNREHDPEASVLFDGPPPRRPPGETFPRA